MDAPAAEGGRLTRRKPMAVTIRHAGPGDEPAVVELVQELAVALDHPSATDEHYVRHYMASAGTDVLLAVDDQNVVGLLSYSVRPGLFHAGDSAVIETLVVLEGRRSEGIGKSLLRAGMRLMAEVGCVEISVTAEADNELAQRLFCDVGLTEASVYLEKHLGR
jgi:ribosomal protein S18 acetylase RimI-like enzyme